MNRQLRIRLGSDVRLVAGGKHKARAERTGNEEHQALERSARAREVVQAVGDFLGQHRQVTTKVNIEQLQRPLAMVAASENMGA